MTRSAACQEEIFDLQAGGHRLRAKAILPEGQSLAGAAATLVFLHEGLGSIRQWRSFPSALSRATGLPALVYDRYGYGQSDPLQEPRGPLYLEEEARHALPDVLAACGIKAPILIGHSDGATIALLFGVLFPSVPLGIVSEAAHVLIEPISVAGIQTTLEAFNTTPLRAQLAKHHGDKVETMFHGWSDVWLAPAYQDWTMVPRLASITAPVLAIQGEEDEYGTPAQVQAILDHVAGPAQALLIPGCGHVPHFQAQDQVLARITTFLQQQVLPRQKI